MRALVSEAPSEVVEMRAHSHMGLENCGSYVIVRKHIATVR